MSESQIQKSFINYLKKLQKEGKNIFYEKRQAGGYIYRKGIPDLYIVINSIHIEVEIKKEGGERSNLQFRWEKYFNKISIPYYVCDNLEEFKKIIKKYL